MNSCLMSNYQQAKRVEYKGSGIHSMNPGSSNGLCFFVFKRFSGGKPPPFPLRGDMLFRTTFWYSASRKSEQEKLAKISGAEAI